MRLVAKLIPGSVSPERTLGPNPVAFKLEIMPAPLISHLCFSLLQLEKPPEKEEDHAPEFIKVRENLRRITTLTSEEKVL